jgi:hypothetical protein
LTNPEPVAAVALRFGTQLAVKRADGSPQGGKARLDRTPVPALPPED